MKKMMILALMAVFCLNSQAQEKMKQKEIGIFFSNIDNFGLSLKTGSNKFKWRFNTMFLSGYHKENHIDTTSKDIAGFGVAIGNEFLKNISDDFEFKIGYDLGYKYSGNKSTNEEMENVEQYSKTIEHDYSINLVLGFNYILKERVILSAELLPYLGFQKRILKTGSEYRDPKKQDLYSGFNYGISNQSVRLTVAYRF